MKISRIVFGFLIVVAFTIADASDYEGLNADEKGLAIAKEAKLRDEGFSDSEELLTMILKDRRGNERIRQMRVLTLERKDDGDWSLSIFDEPADVKGTAMLTYSHGLEPDDQWLYLPALKRVKRISSKNRSGLFMGSEFAFEDLSSFELEKFKYKFLRKEACDGEQCFVSEWIPAYEHSGYSKQIIWHDTNEYRIHRIDYYDRTNKLLKTLKLLQYKQFIGKYWRSMRMDMLNHKTGENTILTYSNYRFKIGLTDRDFDLNALKRAK
ncbi:MAG: outer membrane lipoprotein-sorting protein [Desulfobacterium sp.]|nr:outer membrane lipoprotein-sorting protein [Desulfobacterium sp.]MBU3947235.1 outer membrane lipoprotein-sorting protein [Pseudomonadota bacterium]MBU4035260.1 outer membrane lipoprotein-sorting protein [Pseudomonadota bacterium]